MIEQQMKAKTEVQRAAVVYLRLIELNYVHSSCIVHSSDSIQDSHLVIYCHIVLSLIILSMGLLLFILLNTVRGVLYQIESSLHGSILHLNINKMMGKVLCDNKKDCLHCYLKCIVSSLFLRLWCGVSS